MGFSARKKTTLVVLLIIAAGLGWLAYRGAFTKGVPLTKSRPVWQKGICYVTWDRTRYLAPESDRSLDALFKTGAEWVAVVTTYYQERVYTTRIFPTEKTPSDESIAHAIRYAHSIGKKVMLKPHLDILNVEGATWRGEISHSTDAGWDEWFASYAEFILHYAKMAQDNKVELFCIGTELTSVATIKENVWREKIIRPVRAIYKGQITYAANWNEEYRFVKFWDALDYVGIDPYFPISEKDSPTLDELKRGWERWAKEIEEFQATVSKPIIFPEAGYCSADGTAIKPWEEITGGKLNLKLQADCYEALLATFWDKPWFYGVYWWRWGTDTRFGGPSNKGHIPQNKPAEEVIKKWFYYKPAPYRDPSIFKK